MAGGKQAQEQSFLWSSTVKGWLQAIAETPRRTAF
jgi:hypothetical protein